MKRKASKKIDRFTTDMKRNVFNYKYRGRNIMVMSITLSMLLVLCVGLIIATDVEEETTVITMYEDATIDIVSIDAVKDMVSEVSTEVAEITAVTDVAPKTESEFDTKIVVNTEGTLNIRTEASAESELAGQMEFANIGEIIAVEGEWTKIKSGDVEGYVKSEYVLSGIDAEQFAEQNIELVGIINSEGVRIRTEASTDASIVDYIEIETEVKVVESNDEWVEIELSGESDAETGEVPTGFVCADYIDVEYKYEEALSIEQIAAIEKAEADRKKAEEEATVKKATENTKKTTTSSGSTNSNTSNTSNTTNTTTQSTTNVAVDDSYLLACVVYLEAGGEGYDGQLAVANVILNRVRSGWGSVSSVIYAPGQFGVTSSLSGYVNGSKSPSSTAVQAANDALAGSNNIGSYLYFNRASRVDTTAHPDYIVIGNHCFYN